MGFEVMICPNCKTEMINQKSAGTHESRLQVLEDSFEGYKQVTNELNERFTTAVSQLKHAIGTFNRPSVIVDGIEDIIKKSQSEVIKSISVLDGKLLSLGEEVSTTERRVIWLTRSVEKVSNFVCKKTETPKPKKKRKKRVKK